MRVFATSDEAQFALTQLSKIQFYFVEKLEKLSTGTSFKSYQQLSILNIH